MTDTDLIACIYAFGNVPSNSLNQVSNNVNYVPEKPDAPRPVPLQSHSRSDRQKTEDLEDESPGEFLARQAHLELRFSRGPKSRHGFVFGRNANSDVVLEDQLWISSYHFIITFDDQNRLVVKDPGSWVGTDVIYGKHDDTIDRTPMRRSNFQWIVGGHSHAVSKERTVIHLSNSIRFLIVASRHDINSETYIRNVERFRRGSDTTEGLFQGLSIPPETERPTGTHTPAKGAIFLQENIGRGTYGSVTYLWNVSTGEEKALKEPTSKDFDIHEWRREARILEDVSHFLGFKEVPHPQLSLEYLPGEALTKYKNISARECAKISKQLLSALEYLHGREKPLTHRDIKPGNILVQYRDKTKDRLLVKFGDFGASKESKSNGKWSTVRGTSRYMAPEIAEKYSRGTSDKYTTAVDIWSLGVVLYGLLCDLPHWKEKYKFQGETYSRLVLDALQKDVERASREKYEMLRFLSETMLVMDPASRWSAKDCYEGVQQLSITPTDEDPSLPPTSQIREEQATLLPGEHRGHMDPQTMIRQAEESSKSILARPQMLRPAKRSSQPASAGGRSSKRTRTDATQHSAQQDEEQSTEQGEASTEQEDETSIEQADEPSTRREEGSSAREEEPRPTPDLSGLKTPGQVLQTLERNDALDSLLVGSYLSDLGGKREFSSSLRSEPCALAGGTSQSQDGPLPVTARNQARGGQSSDVALGELEEQQLALQWAIQFSE